VEAEKKLIYIIHFKAFPFNLESVLSLKCMYIFVESQVIAHDIKPEFVNFVVYAEFRKVNVEIS
jgi:hypothetical protein